MIEVDITEEICSNKFCSLNQRFLKGHFLMNKDLVSLGMIEYYSFCIAVLHVSASGDSVACLKVDGSLRDS